MITQKLAMAAVHDIGKQSPNFADEFAHQLASAIQPASHDDIVIRPDSLGGDDQDLEMELWERMVSGEPLAFTRLRRFLVDLIADAFADKPTPQDQDAYDLIHAVFVKTLRELDLATGASVLLCIVGHSLGTVIASNYIYDLWNLHLISSSVRSYSGDTTLERGETLTLLYTLASPLTLFSLLYEDFGTLIQVPTRTCPPLSWFG